MAGHESLDLVVVGGAGHVGLPLSIVLASRGLRVGICDISDAATKLISRGEMPFREPGAQELLEEALQKGLLETSTDPAMISRAKTVVFVVGTPVDEHLNPDPNALLDVLSTYRTHLRDEHLLILRSTIFPGVTARVRDQLIEWGLGCEVVFAPERISEHNAIEELTSLPQILSGYTKMSVERAKAVFAPLAVEFVVVTPEEAELAKLFANAWRYIKFAAANELYMIADKAGLDFNAIRSAMTYEYPRAIDFPKAGFSAGPCLLKDTMQLAAFSDNDFMIGHSAMLTNEGVPIHLVKKLEASAELSRLTIGILGMSFKAGSDDIRSSLSYKLRRLLRFKAREVVCTDPYVSDSVDPSIVSLEETLQRADIIVVATPHPDYENLKIDKPTLDIWGVISPESRFV